MVFPRSGAGSGASVRVVLGGDDERGERVRATELSPSIRFPLDGSKNTANTVTHISISCMRQGDWSCASKKVGTRELLVGLGLHKLTKLAMGEVRREQEAAQLL